jgi:hypothetical protein
MMAGAVYRRHLFNRLIECDVPDHLHEALIEYIASRRPTGRFLTAVLSNDLIGAASRADPVSRAFLVNIVEFLVNYASADCWGSEQKVANWLAAYPEPVPEIFE